jgi:hypothetical protein
MNGFREKGPQKKADTSPAEVEASPSSRGAALRAEKAAFAANVARRERIYRKATGEAGEAKIPQGSGAPLPAPVQRAMEPAIGADLSRVRVHTGGDSAQAATQLGAKAFTVGNDVHFGSGQFTPGTKEGDRLIAHELTHTVQNGKGVQKKAEGVSQPGEPAEKEADAVADHVTDKLHGKSDKAAPTVQAQAPKISRAEDKEAPAKDPELEEILAKLKPFGITFESPPGRVALLLVKTGRGQAVTADEKNQATSAVNSLDPGGFSKVMTALQAFGLLDAYLKAIGEDNAKKTTDQMAVEVPVPAVGFGRVNQAAVQQHFEAANKILEPHNIKVKLGSFVDADQELKREGGAKKLVGDSSGKISGNKLNTNSVGQYQDVVGRIIERLQKPGTLTSFWFGEIIQTPDTEEELAGRAIREAEDSRFRGREAVFVDINADDNVLAHELGHILGGKGAEGKHAAGKDGKPESGDPKNLMFHKPEGGKELTPEQVQAFKTSIYGNISKAQIKPEQKKEG